MCLLVHLQHLGTPSAHCSSPGRKGREKNTHKGVLQDNGTVKETGAQWSPDIIHNIDRRPLSPEGGAL